MIKVDAFGFARAGIFGSRVWDGSAGIVASLPLLAMLRWLARPPPIGPPFSS
jgi:hypothetical protein